MSTKSRARVTARKVIFFLLEADESMGYFVLNVPSNVSQLARIVFGKVAVISHVFRYLPYVALQVAWFSWCILSSTITFDQCTHENSASYYIKFVSNSPTIRNKQALFRKKHIEDHSVSTMRNINVGRRGRIVGKMTARPLSSKQC